MTDYTVTLKLGTFTATIQHLDQQPRDADVLVLDNLVMGWRYASDELHAQLEPLQATVQLAVRHVDNLASLRLGRRAFVELRDETGTTVAGVYGRVAEATAEHVRRWDRLTESYVTWTVYTVTVADHTATEDDTFTALVDTLPWSSFFHELSDWTPDSPQVRLPPGAGTIPGVSTAGGCGARKFEDAGLVTTIREYLPYMVVIHNEDDPNFVPRGMLQLAPIADPVTGVCELLSLHLVKDRTSAPVTIPARRVELQGAWRRGHESDVNTVVARTGPDPDRDPPTRHYRARAADWEPGDQVVRRVLEPRELVAPDIASTEAIARAYLPPAIGDVGWDREGFVYRPEAVSDLASEAWFPVWTTDNYSTEWVTEEPENAARCFTQPVIITDLQEPANLAGGTTYTGRLTSVELTVTGGEVVITFALRKAA